MSEGDTSSDQNMYEHISSYSSQTTCGQISKSDERQNHKIATDKELHAGCEFKNNTGNIGRNPGESQAPHNIDTHTEKTCSENLEEHFQPGFEKSVLRLNDEINYYDDSSVYESVCNSININEFEIINDTHNFEIDSKQQMRKLGKEINQKLKMKDKVKKKHNSTRVSAKDKTKTRTTSCVHEYGLVEDHAHAHARHCTSSEYHSSFYTDFTSDSDHSDSSDVVFRKSFPITPKAHRRNSQQMKVDAEEHIIKKVELRTERKLPSLPTLPDNPSENMLKLRAVLQSLIESEINYMTSLERIKKDYKEYILSTSKKAEVKVVLEKVEDIIEIHRMFQIELSEKLMNWNSDECIGNIFHMFSQAMVVDVYSAYVNNYEAANEALRELDAKQQFREYMLKLQMHSHDRLSLPGLMLKPIQRFPQFIMIIKDLLKYTPRDHHDREPLQEAVTWIENVAHQLNERKRQSEQYFHGHQIMQKLALDTWLKLGQKDKSVFLIRQDEMELLDQCPKEKLSLFLLSKLLVIAQRLPRRDNDPSARFKYKWHHNLSDLELTASTITPNMIKLPASTGTMSSSNNAEKFDNDPLDVASDLTDMLHDVDVLAQISTLVSKFKRSYQGLSVDHIQTVLTKLQTEIQSTDYQLQLMNSSTIILMDKIKKRKYILNALNARMKNDWCIDFLMSKLALDVVNIPSWHQQQDDGVIHPQPCLLMRHLSVDMQKTCNKIKCAVRVYFPLKKEGSGDHLWVCSSKESQGQVSIVAIHTDKPSLIESFQATCCEILCVEAVPGYARVSEETAFENETVWISTADSLISIFMLSENQPSCHRQAVHVFQPKCVVVAMKYSEDHVYCGNRSGSVIVYQRDADGLWSELTKIKLGSDAVTSMVCIGNSMWMASGSFIHIINCDTHKCIGIVDHQLAVTDGNHKHFQYLVKAGVGVWVSFARQPNVCLYHSESRRLIQDFNICNAINEFISVYSGNKEIKRDYDVTCLMASLGFLWVGTNVGITLVYPLPRLREGIPRINQKPWIALHGHAGPVKFIMPVHYGPLGGKATHRRPSTILKSNFIDDNIVHLMCHKNDKSVPHKYLTLDHNAMQQTMTLNSKVMKQTMTLNSKVMQQTMTDSIYEPVEFKGADQTAACSNVPVAKTNENRTLPANLDKTVKAASMPASATSTEHTARSAAPGEHFYYVLESQNSVDVKSCQAGSVPRTAPMERNGFKHNDFKTSGKSVVSADSITAGVEDMSNNMRRLSFISELKLKVQMRSLPEDLIDRDATVDQVGILYPTLVQAPYDASVVEVRQNVAASTSSSAASQNQTESEPTFQRPFLSSRKSDKKPDLSASYKMYGQEDTKTSSLTKKSSSKKLPKCSSFLKEEIEKKQRLSSGGSSFSAGSSVDTLRRQDSNTIMVLTGGDGYKDWKARQSLPNYRPDEACLVFWMYRF